MRQRRMRVIIGAAVAAVSLIAPTTPAHATITGTVIFTCEAHLSLFPSAGGSGNCTVGLTPAAALGVGAGTDTQGHAYVVTGLGTFFASFSYNEGCAGPVPATGSANGNASITGLTAVHDGVVMGARVDTTFSWMRVGLVAVIITSFTRVTFSNGHIAVATMNDVAIAVFVPHPIPTLGTCSAPAPTNATVVGIDVIAS